MILTVGIDLAKNVFALLGTNEAGKCDLLLSSVRRDKLHKLIAPAFVLPHRATGKRGSTESADSAAIREASQRPHMRRYQ